MDIRFGNKLTIEEFNDLRKSVGWDIIEKELAEKTIDNALFIITAVYNGKIIGMARICGDGGYVVIITDVIVKPEFHNNGIGKELMQKIMEHLKNNLKIGQKVFVNLMAAKNKETFYKQFGFEEGPNDKTGAGMTQWIKYNE
jgi:predicted GNAT family N-acyltransferase